VGGVDNSLVVLANNLSISLTILLNSTAVTTFELHIDEEVDNDNKLYKWYERSMIQTVHGTNGLHVVRIVNGTKSPDTGYNLSLSAVGLHFTNVGLNGLKSP